MVTNRSHNPSDIFIVGSGQTDFVPSHRANTSTSELLFSAALEALADAGLNWQDIDGLGLSSFTAAPDHAIDFAVRWNIKPRWLMDSALGGASGIDLLQHAHNAIAAGSAQHILLVSGDHFENDDFADLVRRYNRSAMTDFPDMPAAGPNANFALLTQLQMARFGISRADYGGLVVRQRMWASENPHAAHRSPLDLDEYLGSEMVADPLSRYDCVPVVSGATAMVVSSEYRPNTVRILGTSAHHNWDSQNGDGLVTGIAIAAPQLWQATGKSPKELDVVSVYDDYPAMAIAQLLDCGILDTPVSSSLQEILSNGRPAINSSGGQLSAGQAGAAGGMQGLIEVSNALRDRGPERTHGSALGLVCGYGMVTYRYGSCANVALLERAK